MHFFLRFNMKNTITSWMILEQKVPKILQQKQIPGPLAPPETNRPNRKITALSYSCTI